MSTLVSVTFAPGTTAPDASRTVPTTVAVSNCAQAGTDSNSAHTITNHRTLMSNLIHRERAASPMRGPTVAP